jgi:anthranilate phosphoribosyltransferase
VGELVKGEINEYTLHPAELGLALYDRRAIEVHTVAESKAMIQAVLENQPGPAHNIVALNAGAALYVAGVTKSLKAGIERAAQAIASGAARQKLEDFVAFSQKLKKA